MSPHGIGISGHPDQSSQNSGISGSQPDPYRCQISSPPEKKFVRYPQWKICAPEKVDQSPPKSLKTCYAPMPVIVPNFIAFGQSVYEKSVTIFTPFTFWRPRGPLGPKFTNPGGNVQQGPVYQSAKFRPVLTIRDTSCQKFVDFGDSVTDTQTNKKQTVNNISLVSVLPCGDRKRRNTSGRQKVNRHSSSVS